VSPPGETAVAAVSSDVLPREIDAVLAKALDVFAAVD
jgi:hypothetical protein